MALKHYKYPAELLEPTDGFGQDKHNNHGSFAAAAGAGLSLLGSAAAVGGPRQQAVSRGEVSNSGSALLLSLSTLHGVRPE